MSVERDTAWEIIRLVNRYIIGKEESVSEIMTAFLADGHILLEDIPGVGKTKMALIFSKAMGLDWKRVQFTPDVMPSDLTGFSIYRKDTGNFVYRRGNLFCNLMLADEINRTTPKTQSALLEAMEERQVTAEGITRPLEKPFLVVATQNPLGSAGTQPLPPAQMDRFMISLTIGYPDFESEVRMAMELYEHEDTDAIRPLTNKAQFLQMQKAVSEIYIHENVYRYIVELVTETRNHPYLEYGASPRATISLVRMSQAAAWLNGKTYVTPVNVARQFPYVVKHRIQRTAASRMQDISKEDIIHDILDRVGPPQPGRKGS